MPVKRPVCLICLVFLFLILTITGARGPDPSWDVDSADGRTVSAVGTVFDRQEKGGTLQVFLKDVSFNRADQAYFPETSKGIVVKLTDEGADTDMIRMGAKIEARGVFKPFERPRCEGMFDSRQYYLIRGYEGQLKRAHITGVSRGYDHVSDALRRVRDRAFSIFLENMTSEDAGLVAAMTLGDKTGLESDIKELYQRVGISHVLALSGLHIASVGLAVLSLLKRTGLPSPVCSVVSFLLIMTYAVMTGLATSTVRAMVMFGLFCLASLIGRTYDLLSAASVSALVILLFDPYYVYDTGFLLSFGAVCAIACIYPMLENLPSVIRKYASGRRGASGSEAVFGNIMASRKSLPKKISVKLYQSVCVSLSVMIATLPVIGKSFMQVAVWSVIINLLVIPLMGLVLLTGFMAIFVGFSGIEPGPILKITHYILWFFETVGNFFEKFPGNLVLVGQPAKWQLITYAIIVVLAVITWNVYIGDPDLITRLRKSIDRIGRRSLSGSGSYLKKSDNKITYIIESVSDRTKKNLTDLLVSLITVVIIMISVVILAFHPASDLEIRNIDVGQGDCALIIGKGLPSVMIDGGSSDIKQVAKYRIMPVLKANRISVIDRCFLTHMDSDHVNGILEILEDEGCGIRIRSVIVSSGAVTADNSGSDAGNDNWERLNDVAKRRNVPILVMTAGDVISFDGPHNKTFRLECVSSSGSDANDSSLVLKLEYDDLTALFTGDISEDVENAILPLVPDCDYLKVAHHGSRYSSSAAFLNKASPEMSVISAGIDNSYGHPHEETLERLGDCKTKVFCTQSCGEIITVLSGKKLSVQRFMSK